jgi:hypothetical protein
VDVVVPRKVHEVHDLLVIANDRAKAALVTSFVPRVGYLTRYLGKDGHVIALPLA